MVTNLRVYDRMPVSYCSGIRRKVPKQKELYADRIVRDLLIADGGESFLCLVFFGSDGGTRGFFLTPNQRYLERKKTENIFRNVDDLMKQLKERCIEIGKADILGLYTGCYTGWIQAGLTSHADIMIHFFMNDQGKMIGKMYLTEEEIEIDFRSEAEIRRHIEEYCLDRT